MNIQVFAKIFRFSVTFSIQRHERSGGRSQCQAGASATAGGGNTKKAKRWESSHVEPIRYKPGYVIGGLEHFFFYILGIIIPTDFHIFQRD